MFILTNKKINTFSEYNYKDFIQLHFYYKKSPTIQLFEDDDIFIYLDGLIFNNHTSGFYELINKKNDLKKFLLDLRGFYLIVIYIKNSEKVIISSDRYSTKPIFLINENKRLIVCSNVLVLVKMGIVPVKINESAVASFLTFRYLFENQTWIQGVAKLSSGNAIEINARDGNVTQFQYYKMLENYGSNILSKSSLMEELIERVRIASQSIFRDNNKKSLVTLSGGLDSRIVLLNALLSKNNVDVLTFGKKRSDDVNIASNISEILKLNHIYHDLENGDFIVKNAFESFLLNDGSNFFISSIHFLDTLNSINSNDYSIIHTGMTMDAIFGSLLEKIKKHKKDDINIIDKVKILTQIQGYLSSNSIIKNELKKNKLYNDIIFNEIEGSLKNFKLITDIDYYRYFEEWILRNRVEQYTFSGFRVIENFMNYTSIGYYPEVFDFAYSLPLKFRFDEQLYIEYYRKKLCRNFPEIKNIKWDTVGGIPFTNKYIRNILHFNRRLKRKLSHKIIPNYENKRHMNPWEYWYINNEYLHDFLQLQKHEYALLHEIPLINIDTVYKYSNFLTFKELILLKQLTFISSYFLS